MPEEAGLYLADVARPCACAVVRRKCMRQVLKEGELQWMPKSVHVNLVLVNENEGLRTSIGNPSKLRGLPTLHGLFNGRATGGNTCVKRDNYTRPNMHLREDLLPSQIYNPRSPMQGATLPCLQNRHPRSSPLRPDA
jgi:hypothetical protein